MNEERGRRLVKSLRRIVVVLGLTFTISIGFSGLTSETRTLLLAQSSQDKPSSEYLEALQMANSFLWAWVNRNAEVGLRLMSNRLRSQTKNEAWLRQFMVGLSNPHHQAFKIWSDQIERTNKYVFSVTLYELYTGEPKGIGYTSDLEVVKEGNTWRVDRLPRSSDNP
jgi:hypothetical protein